MWWWLHFGVQSREGASLRLAHSRDGRHDGRGATSKHDESAGSTSHKRHLWHRATISSTSPRPIHDTTTTKNRVPLTQAVESVFLGTPPPFLSEPVDLEMRVCCCHESTVLHCKGLLISKQMFHRKHINRDTCRVGNAFSLSSRADASNNQEPEGGVTKSEHLQRGEQILSKLHDI